jgi:hypothetical protein
MKRSIFFYLLLYLLIHTGCNLTPEGKGEFDEIIVFSDSLDWFEYKISLESIFSREYKTPVLEKEYILTWRTTKYFEDFKEYRNVIFLCRLDSDDKVSEAVKNTLSEEIIQDIENDKYFYIPKPDAWANNQIVLFLVAKNKEDMFKKLDKYGNSLLKDFEKSYYRRYQDHIFRRDENKELEEYIENHFPFTMKVQSDFFLADESVENGYIYLRRINPDRSMIVHWIPYSDTIQINYNWIVSERNRIGALGLEGDLIVEDETEYREGTFLGEKAFILEGTWKNPTYIIGGPFRNKTFIDETSNLIIMVDYYIHAVGRRKKLFLDQLEVMARTINVKAAVISSTN